MTRPVNANSPGREAKKSPAGGGALKMGTGAERYGRSVEPIR